MKVCFNALNVLQAMDLDARASRVKWPAQFMWHWYGISFTEYVFECRCLSYNYSQIPPYVGILDNNNGDDDNNDINDDDNDNNDNNNDNSNNNHNNNDDYDYDNKNNKNNDNDYSHNNDANSYNNEQIMIKTAPCRSLYKDRRI